MGAFYESILTRAPRARVLEVLGTAYAAALVGPTRHGWTIATPDADGRLDDHVAEVALTLSREGTTVCTTVHDDDILLLQAYDGGELVATYDSAPDYFSAGEVDDVAGPDVSQLDALGRVLGLDDLGPLRQVLTGDYLTETDRLAEAVMHLGLPPYVVLFGYDYAVDGDLPSSLTPDDLEAVGSA